MSIRPTLVCICVLHEIATVFISIIHPRPFLPKDTVIFMFVAVFPIF